MDYESMSDFEINKAVRLAVNGEPVSDFDKFFAELPCPNYCNNASDAWPIIIENNIDIEWFFCPDFVQIGCGEFNVTHKTNALRAAMIGFLKMQEQSNDQG